MQARLALLAGKRRDLLDRTGHGELVVALAAQRDPVQDSHRGRRAGSVDAHDDALADAHLAEVEALSAGRAARERWLAREPEADHGQLDLHGVGRRGGAHAHGDGGHDGRQRGEPPHPGCVCGIDGSDPESGSSWTGW